MVKKLLIGSSLGLLLATFGILIVRAEGTRWDGWHRGVWAFGGGPLGYIAYRLQLNDTQRAQIKTMWQTERPAVASLVKELADESHEMDAASAKGSLDEAKVQAIAARQGEAVTKLLVEKEHLRAKIYTEVLNQEQRDKADELLKTLHERLDRVASCIGGGEPHS